MTDSANDFFFDAYDRDEIAYGMTPSASLAAFLDQFGSVGLAEDARALDLGAGAGRDTLAMARAGFNVTSVDISQRGLQRISERAERLGVGDKVTTKVSDARKFEMPANRYDVVIGTTVLDHIPASGRQGGLGIHGGLAGQSWRPVCRSSHDGRSWQPGCTGLRQ